MKYRLFAFNVLPTDTCTYTTFMVNMINMINMISALKITGRNFYNRLPPPLRATLTQFYPSNLQAITYISVKYRLCNLMHKSEAASYVSKSKGGHVMGEGGLGCEAARKLRGFNNLETVYE